jgi:hypothetical protein
VSLTLPSFFSSWPTNGRFIKRDRKFRVEPLCQVSQPPAHNPIDRWDRTALDDRQKGLVLGIIKLSRLTRCLAITERIWATGIELHNPIAHDFQTNAANPCSIAPTAAIVNLSQRQHPAALVRVLRFPCKTLQCRAVKVRT